MKPITCYVLVAYGFVLIFNGPITAYNFAQEPSDVKTLERRVEELNNELATARVVIETLTKRIAELEATGKPGPKKAIAKEVLSDRMIEGAVLKGDYRSPSLQGKIGHIQLEVIERQGKLVTCTSTISVEGRVLGDFRMQGRIDGERLKLDRVGAGKGVRLEVGHEKGALSGKFIDGEGGFGKVGLLFVEP